MTTNQFKSINFLNQTGDFNYNLNLKVNNSTGYFEFGFSGANKLTFKSQYGKIKDSNDNIIIGYVANRDFKINGSIISGKETLTIDDTLIYSNIPNTGYNFNYFYLNPIGCSLDYNFSLTGGYTELSSTITTPKIKDYNIVVDDKNNPFVTKTLTGILVNQNPNLEVKIFSGVATTKTDTYSLYGFPITFNNTGTYLINSNTGIDALVNDTFDALFYTNFGNIIKTISISGEVIPLFFLFFDVSPAISGFPNVQTGYDQIFVNTPKDYSLSYGYVSGANVQLSLSYVSGLTGNVTGFLSATGKFNGTLSGYLTGSGYISSYVATGVLFSGGNDFLNNIEYVTDSGFYAQQFKVATGYSKGDYVITGYGLGSGYLYESVFATGKVRVLVTGNVPYVGGLTIGVNPYPFIGTGIAYDQNNSGFTATGIVDGYFPNFAQLLYTGALTGVILSSAQYSGKDFSFVPPKDYVTVSSAPYKILATGYESGIGGTGIVDGGFFIDLNQGYYTFVKNFTGVKGESRAMDQEQIITGYLGIINCNVSQQRKYISFTSGLSGVVTGSAYLSLCDADSAMPSGFIASATTTGAASLYVITGECEEPGQILDQALPKFILIKPTGTYELQTRALETGVNYALNQEAYYLLNDTGIRTHIFGAGSGYFSNIIGDCKNSGRWEHMFYANEILVEENTSDYIVNNINFDLITLEDDGQDYFSEVDFTVSGSLEKFNLILKGNNIPINQSPSRNIYYNLIISKKINSTLYSGFYESSYTNIVTGIQFCTGLSQGDYKAKVKYVNVSTAPTGKTTCRVPIQILNIVDKNYYNENNIDLFTGSLVYDFDTFRYRGNGYHHQSNVYYTRSEVYGTQFLTTTGSTSNYRENLYKAAEQHSTFIYDNSIVKAIQYSLTGITGWEDNAVKNINIITNNISLSGWNRNDFLNYIKSINLSEQIIFNTLNCPNSNSLSDNFNSSDSSDEFLRDIAVAGGGTYYNCSNVKSAVDNYGGYNGLVPLSSQPVYVTCSKYYPINSQPPIESPNFYYENGEIVKGPEEGISNQTTITDSRSGYLGIDIIPIEVIPQPPTGEIVSLPIPNIELPNITVDIEPVGTLEGPLTGVLANPIQRVYGGGALGGNWSTPSSNPYTWVECDRRDERLGIVIDSRGWNPEPATRKINGICVCDSQGTYIIKGRIFNTNCIGFIRKIAATLTVRTKFSSYKYQGETKVTILGVGNAPIPTEPKDPWDATKPDPNLSSVASIQRDTWRGSTTTIGPNPYQGSTTSIGPNPYNGDSVASIQRDNWRGSTTTIGPNPYQGSTTSIGPNPYNGDSVASISQEIPIIVGATIGKQTWNGNPGMTLKQFK
jgi:hypothetical protein